MVAYIVESSKRYFKAFVAHTVELEGDNDSTLFVLASGGKSEKLEEVQEFLKTNVPNDVEKNIFKPYQIKRKRFNLAFRVRESKSRNLKKEIS